MRSMETLPYFATEYTVIAGSITYHSPRAGRDRFFRIASDCRLRFDREKISDGTRELVDLNGRQSGSRLTAILCGRQLVFSHTESNEQVYD